MEILESIWNAVWSDDNNIAWLFFDFIFIWFVVAATLVLFGKISPQNWTSRFAVITPRTLVMLGVFGTFLGILIGLLDFDVTNINASVPLLLDGLKVAFTTSVVGIFFALVFQVITIFFPLPAAKGDDIPAAIHETLKEQRDLLKESIEEQVAIRRGQEKLITEFREFERKIAENLIKALEDVTRKFDVILQNLVGESFKKLAEAVNQLVEWQENYKQYIEKTQQQLSEIVTSLEASKTALETIRTHTEAIPNSVKQLEDILKAVNNALGAFATLREDAEKALPRIKENLETITGSLVNGGKEIESNAQKLSKQMQDSVTKMENDTRKQLEDINKNMTKWLEEFGGNLVSLSNQFVKDYRPLTEELQRLINGIGRTTAEIENKTNSPS